MPPNPRPALQTIVRAAGFARDYIESTGAGRVESASADPHQEEVQHLLQTGLLIKLRRMAEAVQKLSPAVRAMRPKAPWLGLGMFEHIDPLRPEYFFATYPDGVLSKVLRTEVIPLARAAAQILAEIEERGLPAPPLAPPAAPVQGVARWHHPSHLAASRDL